MSMREGPSKTGEKRHMSLRRLLVFAVWIFFLILGASEAAALKMPEDISTYGYRIDRLLTYTTTIVSIYFGIVVLALLFFIIRYRAREGRRAVYDHGNRKRDLLVTGVLAMSVFIIIDMKLEVDALKDLKEAIWNYPTGEDTLHIGDAHVKGYQGARGKGGHFG